MKYPPLKRHVSLQPLSRDHYLGLVQAQHLIRSAEADAPKRAKVLGEFLQAWTEEISVHFGDEERLLSELLAGEPLERLRREHRTLTALAAEAGCRAHLPDPGAEWVRELGRLLNDHIRWEERALFPVIERHASPEQLSYLKGETTRLEHSRARNNGSGKRSR